MMKSLFEISKNELEKHLSKNKKIDIAIIHLTFEGIQTYGGGVCSVIRGHIEALKVLKNKLKVYGIEITPYFCEIAYAGDHERRDIAYEKYAKSIIEEMGGEIIYLTNFSRGYLPKASWGVGDLGGIENWKTAGASGASAALNITKKHQAGVIYCHDSLYSFAPIYIALQSDAYDADALSILVLHSTALTHELPLPNPERLMAESAAIHWAKISPKVKLGYISKFIRNHIIKDYGASIKNMVPVGNGINPQNEIFRQRSPEEIKIKLKEYNIPVDRELFVTWGRAVEYKRYDVNLKAAARLKNEIHPVVVITPKYPELETLAKKLGINVSFVYKFDPELIASLCQWEKSVAVGILSKFEPCGLIPMEMRMYSRNTGALLIVSDTGGLFEQVNDGVDGFVSKQDDDKDVAKVIKRILNLPDEEKTKIRKNGFVKVLKYYTWTSQILITLSSVFSSLRNIFNRVKKEIINDLRDSFLL